MKEILRAAAKSGAGMVVSLLCAAVAVKIIALVTGPAGVGLFSLLRQTQQTASIMGSLGGQAAIVQGLASKAGPEKDAYFVVVLRAVLVCTIAVCCFITISAPYLAPLILGPEPSNVQLFRLLAIPTLLGSGTLFLSGVINSHKAVGILALVQGVAGASLALFAYPLSRNAGNNGFVFLLCLSGITGFSAAVYFCTKNDWLVPLKDLFERSKESASLQQFLKIGGTTLVTGLMSTGTVLIVRATVSGHMGLHGAGLFDAAWTLSMTYVMLILTSFSTFYLPTLSAIQNSDEQRRQLISQIFHFATYASIPLIATVMLLRPWVIQLLYSKEFLPAVDMMRWMLLGDYLKITSWVLAMPMLAFADMKSYFLSELAWNLGFIILTTLLLESGGPLEYIGIIFFILYFAYLIYAYMYCVRRYKFRTPKRIALVWLSGFCLLLAITWHT